MTRGFTMTRLLFVPVTLVALAAPLAAEVGSIVYLDGEVEVVRDGERIWQEIDFGFPLESYDLIRTGDNGLVELELDEPAGLTASITVEPNTSFYLDVSAQRTDSPSGVELLGGSVRLALQQYGAGFEVRTEAATMGVRGTVFDVVTSVRGDILVTCEEGAVVCSTDSGPELVATPGRAVEARVGERLRNLTVGGANLESFQREWMRDRLSEFRSTPVPLLNLYAERYFELRTGFAEAYRDLMSRRDVLDKWRQEDRLGSIGTMMERMRERRAVLPGLFRMRRVLFFLERIWFRLDVLLQEAGPELAGRQLGVGVTLGELRRRFENDAGLLTERMDEVRYVFKLFAERNDGRLPFEEIEDPFGDAPRENESDDPFSGDPFSDDPFPIENRDDN